jgi:hypothetical protein
VPEAGGSKIEIAQHLSKHEDASTSRTAEILEIAEAVALAPSHCESKT